MKDWSQGFDLSLFEIRILEFLIGVKGLRFLLTTITRFVH